MFQTDYTILSTTVAPIEPKFSRFIIYTPIRISVADATNHHFAGQRVLGLVTSFIPYSDVPGPNMEVLPSCQVWSLEIVIRS
jgi:hypothetical protein